MDRRYQVFISSTFTDLKDERQEVIQVLLEMDCFPAGMEMFPAANHDQWTLIKDVILKSDYYLVIVGGRYGSTTEEDISYTEKEYDFAVDNKIPVIGFVHADPDNIPIGRSEASPGARRKLDSFRAKVMSRMVKSYTSPSDLGSAVSRALNPLMRNHPRPGWVRGDFAMTPEVRAEIAELKAHIANLEKERIVDISVSEDHMGIDTSFAHGQDEIELRGEFFSSVFTGFTDFKTGISIAYTWDRIIEVLGPAMITEASEDQLRMMINNLLLQDALRLNPDWNDPDEKNASISAESWGTIIVQLRALGLIRIGDKRRAPSDLSAYWSLTPAGDQYLVNLRAIKRPTLEV